MIFPSDLSVDLGPSWLEIPFADILSRWIHARFEPEACRRALLSCLDEAGVPEGLIDVDAVRRGGVVLTEAALFAPAARRKLTLRRYERGRDLPCTGHLEIQLEDDEVESAADLLRDGAAQRDVAVFRADYAHLGDGFLDRILRAPGAAGSWAWPPATSPGIYRREHASLLIRSREASVLLDPLSSMITLPHLERTPAELGTAPDLIAITHSHGDHWHLPSLLRAAGSRDTPVLVPRVPRVNLLTPIDMATELELTGQRSLAVPWGETLVIKDIEIDVLPFYGEQPTREAPGPAPEVRSWGNCYRVNTEDFSVLVLADTGADPAGAMADVVARSYGRRGPVDVVLACMREFHSPFFGGLSTYWGGLPFARLAALFQQYEAGRLPFTTAGAAGIAEICDMARAGHFLSYANGFQGIGEEILDIGWGGGEPTEAQGLTRLRRALSERGAATAVHAWRTGDHAVPSRGRRGLIHRSFRATMAA
ncbi:MBL fold metallo-hydrolase [Sorangium sp. So ce1389]|uniref:MBL fold metallo-hydrolase n=1 Tax=Sorangium sp. So ce1389 TaxID=3133336 RepID=UPI003F5F5FDE